MTEKTQINIPAATLAPIIEEQLREGKTVRFAPKGRSMLPMIREGRDTVTLCAVDRPLKKYDIGFYRRRDGQYVLHRIVKTGESITCIGDGQYVYERGLSKDLFIGVVCEFSRDNKVYSTEHIGYKIYCRLWHLSRPVRYFVKRAFGKLGRILKGKA